MIYTTDLDLKCCLLTGSCEAYMILFSNNNCEGFHTMEVPRGTDGMKFGLKQLTIGPNCEFHEILEYIYQAEVYSLSVFLLNFCFVDSSC